jgi:hypothetical protein
VHGNGLVHLGKLKSILGEKTAMAAADHLETLPQPAGGSSILEEEKKTGSESSQKPAEPNVSVRYDDLLKWLFNSSTPEPAKPEGFDGKWLTAAEKTATISDSKIDWESF